jgi:PKD repeat protein
MNDDGSYEYSGATPTVPWADLSGLPQPGVAVPIRLRVTDTFGAINSNATTLTIYDNRPVADFTASPNPAAPTQVITFDGSPSYHTHPGHSIVLYEWDFDTDGTFDASSASPTTTYAYASFGAFTATLRVTDDNTPAKTDSTSLIIQINQGNRPPVADADGPYSIDIGADLPLDGTGSYDPDAAYGDSIVSYEWDMNDDGSYEYSGATPTVPWADLSGLPQPGVAVPIRLRVTDTFGATDSNATTLTIFDNRPVADFIASPNPAAPTQVITFDGSSSYHTHPGHSIILYEWDFDTDGTFDASSASPTTTYAYSSFGAFTAMLRVTDDNTPAKTDSTSLIIQINQGNRPPVADADGPYVLYEGGSITLDGSGSYDPDTAYGDSIVAYEWDLDNDGQYADALGATIMTAFNDDGSYTIGLRVTDSFGASGTDTATVTVEDLAPTAAFTWNPEPQNEGSAIVFTDMSTSSPDNIVSRTWDFAGMGTSPAVNPSFTFMDNGIYTVTLTVTDEDGSTDTISHDVTINDLAPTAAFTWSPEPQNEGSAVTFNDMSTSSPDIIVSRTWDFAGLGTSPAINPSFIFIDNGSYTVTLTVTDEDGSTDTASHDITINDLAPTATLTGDTALDEGQIGNYDASGSTSSPDAIMNYEWDWEYDGTTFNPSGDTGTLQSHSWPAGGIYTVAVRVTDDDGSTGIAALIVTVSRINNPPVANDVPAVTDQDTPVNIMLSAYDPDGDDLSYGIVSPPVNGTLSGTAPDLTYTPNAGYTGPDSFTYMVNDGYLDSNTATVTITVNPVSVEAVLFAVEYAWGAPAPGYKWDPFPLIFIGWTHVRIENRGNTDVYNVTASITGYPTSQTVPDPDVTIGDIAAGASAWSIDTFTTRTDMTITVDPCDGWVWRIEYDDEFGVHHIIENVPEFPPGEGPCG